MFSARRDNRIASVPLATPMACVVCDSCATSRSRRSTGSPRMKAWSSMTLDIALMTESRMVACCAFKSRSGTAIGCGIDPKRCKLLKIYFHASDLCSEWKWHLPSRLGRLVDAQNQLQRLPARPAVRIGLCLTAKDGKDVSVIALMPQPIDVGRIRLRRDNQLVIVIVLGELPEVHLVHRRPADFHRSLLPEDRERAFEVAWIGEHGDLDGPERPRPEFQNRDTGVFG